MLPYGCLLYTSDAADDLTRVDLGGRRIIKKNTHEGPCVFLSQKSEFLLRFCLIFSWRNVGGTSPKKRRMVQYCMVP